MESASYVAALVTIIQAVTGWDLIGLVVFLFIIPPALVAYALIKVAKAVVSLREEVKRDAKDAELRYLNNVELVKQYEAMAKELIPVIQVNTEAMTRLVEYIKNTRKG